MGEGEDMGSALGEAKYEYYSILKKNKHNLTAPAAVNDFHLGNLQDNDDSTNFLYFTPYAVDISKRKILEVGTKDGRFDGPFLYLDQYQRAELIRYSFLEEYENAQNINLPSITFLFSIGRAGSTLAARLADVIGFTSLSEPDILLQLGDQNFTERLNLSKLSWTKVYRNAIAMLCQPYAKDAPILIKFRAQNSNDFHVKRVYSEFPNEKYVFLFREPVSWAQSFIRSFSFNASTLIWLYDENIKACKYLISKGANVSVTDYKDLVVAPTTYLNSIQAGLDLEVDPMLIEKVLNEDSQKGIFLDGINEDRDSLDEFLDWWKAKGSIALAEMGISYDISLK